MTTDLSETLGEKKPCLLRCSNIAFSESKISADFIGVPIIMPNFSGVGKAWQGWRDDLSPASILKEDMR
jgi:hypothetical protein